MKLTPRVLVLTLGASRVEVRCDDAKLLADAELLWRDSLKAAFEVLLESEFPGRGLARAQALVEALNGSEDSF